MSEILDQLREFFTALNEDAPTDPVRDGWGASMESLPSGPLSFLEPSAVRENRAFCGLSPEMESDLLETAEQIDANVPLRKLAWHLYSQLFLSLEKEFPGDSWPELTYALGDRAGIFYLLVGMSLAPLLKQQHADAGIPIEVTQDTCKAVHGFCLNHQKGYAGNPGIFKYQIGWLQRHARGEIYRVGRLEYYVTRLGECYEGGCAVYRHTQSRRISVLAPDGAYFDQDGRMCPVSSDETWTAKLDVSESEITGSPISTKGLVERKAITLSADEWTLEMDPQSWVLSMHIPNGGRLSLEIFKDSMERAYTFFDRHFPETPTVSMVCKSWLYGEMLEEILPAKSNIIKNLRELYFWGSPREMADDSLWFIFCQTGDKSSVENIEASSSLEQAVLDYVRAGGAWREGFVFHLRNDLPTFGTQFYRV